jgi:hypothetical protein
LIRWYKGSVRELNNFRPFCDVASTFWQNNVLAPGDRVILVEAMSQDLRVTLRNLTVANALRRFESAHLVVFSGSDEDWNQVVWTYFNLEEISAMARAYGAEHVFDVHELVDQRVAGAVPDLTVAGVDLGGPLPAAGIPDDVFDQIVDATTCRMVRVARLDGSEEHRVKRATVAARSREFAKVYDALLGQLDVVALVSSHVDYNNFGLAVEAALRHDVPVLFPQSTGGLKSYALFPESQLPGAPVRAGLTVRIGEYFDKYIWPNRDLFRHPAELTMWRAKATLGRPSWWRAGRSYSSTDLRGAEDRSVVRTYAARRTGLDPEKPVVTVFNHAVSDALGTNVEAFADLGEWFDRTAAYAADHPEVNWLFLDHPSQRLYDGSDFFGGVAARHRDRPHLKFMPSMDLSKNFLTSLTDLVLTVRGSVSNEYPALGIPAIQSGWSEWSHCGFTTVTETPEEYFAALQDHLEGLLAGVPLITDEQVERARLWAWFYRSATDVPSGLVQQWRVGEEDPLFDLLSINMLQVESDADPAFVAVRRMWSRREPFLTRLDWSEDRDEVVAGLAPVEQL